MINSDLTSRPQLGFKFGLETEYIVIELKTLKPLWHPELDFNGLYQIIEKISLEGIKSLKGLDLEPPHKAVLPYVVEGYHTTDSEGTSHSMMPKGLEIRTPVCDSIEECLQQHSLLLQRLISALKDVGLGVIALSHHPFHWKFSGPQNKRRHDFWLWAMEVMTTYGPDINVGLPTKYAALLSSSDFQEKINYYSPALTALSLASPFREGALWKVKNEQGLSLRTYRRSVIAPPNENHPHENDRIEYKVFDMATGQNDYKCFFLLFLTLVLSEDLKGRSSAATRIYDMGEVAVEGLNSAIVKQRLNEIFTMAEKVLPLIGYQITDLNLMIQRFKTGSTPAQCLIKLFNESDSKIEKIVEFLLEKTRLEESVDAGYLNVDHFKSKSLSTDPSNPDNL